MFKTQQPKHPFEISMFIVIIKNEQNEQTEKSVLHLSIRICGQ